MLARSDDPFWSVVERERAEETNLRREIAATEAQLDVIRRVDALKHAAGFSDFLKSLERMHKTAREKLVGDERLTDQGLREQRGRVKGLESVLTLLTSSGEQKLLAERRESLQNALDEALKRRPKPKREETSNDAIGNMPQL